MRPLPVGPGAVGDPKSICDFSGSALLFSELCRRYGSGNVDWWIPVEGEVSKAELIRGLSEAFCEPVSMLDAAGTRAATKVRNNETGAGAKRKPRLTIHWVVVQRNHWRSSSRDGHHRDCARLNATRVLRGVDQRSPHVQVVWISHRGQYKTVGAKIPFR